MQIENGSYLEDHSKVNAYRVYRSMRTKWRPLMNSSLVSEGQGHLPASTHESAFTISPLRSLLRPTYCSWFVTAQKNLHRPVLVDLWANTETLRSCEPASPTSRRSAPRAASTGRFRNPLSSSCASASSVGILLKSGHLSVIF